MDERQGHTDLPCVRSLRQVGQTLQSALALRREDVGPFLPRPPCPAILREIVAIREWSTASLLHTFRFWTKRMLAFRGPAQPSPTLGDALNAGYLYLEVRCLGCDTHQTVALDIVRRPKTTPAAGRAVTLPSRGAPTDFSILVRPVRDQAVGAASRAPSCQVVCRYYSLCE